MGVRRRLSGWRGILVILGIMAFTCPGSVGAVEDRPPYVPEGAIVVQTARLDADGDGVPDMVVLYARRIESSERVWLNGVVLRDDRPESSALTLFAPPGPDQPHGEPVMDLASVGTVSVRDLSAGSQPGLALAGPDSLDGEQRVL